MNLIDYEPVLLRIDMHFMALISSDFDDS